MFEEVDVAAMVVRKLKMKAHAKDEDHQSKEAESSEQRVTKKSVH